MNFNKLVLIILLIYVSACSTVSSNAHQNDIQNAEVSSLQEEAQNNNFKAMLAKSFRSIGYLAIGSGMILISAEPQPTYNNQNDKNKFDSDDILLVSLGLFIVGYSMYELGDLIEK